MPVAIGCPGFFYAANHIPLLAAKTAGFPVLMRGDTHLGLPRSSMKSMLRRPTAPYRSCDRLLVVGSATQPTTARWGLPAKKIFILPYSGDNDRFVQSASLTDDQKAAIRKLHVPSDWPFVLYAAKFTYENGSSICSKLHDG